MIIYKIECINEDGDAEDNGYYLKKEKAEAEKVILDNQPFNIRYGIKQTVVEIFVEE